MRRLLAGIPVLCLATGAQAATWQSCMAEQPIPITVRIGAHSPPVPALLRGGVLPRINVVERDTGRVLWTAADTPPAMQQFPQMRAAFAGSFVAVDLDGDGVHDRLYAGDLAGRLWRFDLHHGAEPAHWASGGIWADFSAVAGRGFVAAPDVSLSTPPGQKPWLNIAAGTAHTSNSVVSNRFYVLRDRKPFDVWSDAEYSRWQPLRDADLLALGRSADAATAVIERGYYFELGTADVLAPALTVSGRATLAISARASGSDPCQVAITVSSFNIDTATPVETQKSPTAGETSTPTPTVVLPAGSGLVLTRNDAGQAVCTLGDVHIAACDVNTKPVPTYWRRQDAD